MAKGLLYKIKTNVEHMQQSAYHEILKQIERRLDQSGSSIRDKVRHLTVKLLTVRSWVISSWMSRSCEPHARDQLMLGWLLHEKDMSIPFHDETLGFN